MSTQTLDALDPQELKDYDIEWATLLAGETETAISSSTWGASVPPGLTVNSSTLSDTRTTVWVSGGTPGVTYGLTNHIVTTALGRKHDGTIFIPCRQH